MNYRISIQSAKLVRLLRRKDRIHNKCQKNYDVITACLQALSQKRSEFDDDTLLVLSLPLFCFSALFSLSELVN